MVERLAVVFIRVVSGFFHALAWRGCRFAPTCSEYAVEAFRRFSPPKALFLSLNRVMRCHPFCEGGYDPLSPRKAAGTDPEKEK